MHVALKRTPTDTWLTGLRGLTMQAMPMHYPRMGDHESEGPHAVHHVVPDGVDDITDALAGGLLFLEEFWECADVEEDQLGLGADLDFIKSSALLRQPSELLMHDDVLLPDKWGGGSCKIGHGSS